MIAINRMAWAAVAALAILAGAAAGPAKAQDLARGKYLVNGIAGCGNCHTAKGGPFKGVELAGGFTIGDDKGPFVAHVPNITPDKETGIGTWTDEQIMVAIRQGKRPDGTAIGPPMAIDYYQHMSDNDVKAIVAYIKTVKPVKHKVPKSVYRIPVHAFPPPGHVRDVDPANKVLYGKYLATIGHCMECHTPMVRGRRDYKNRFGAGGEKFEGPWGENISANITQDKETGIGKWTDAQIKRAITKGVRHDGTRMRPPMCFQCYDTMTDRDIDAIVAYLRTVKPVKHQAR